jgi:WD repeat-containing protein 42A
MTQEYPFVCTSVILSGHSANIFSVQMLPHSSRIATAAGDKQVRVFDVKTASASAVSDRLETEYSVKQSCIKILHCHDHRVKRIITEDSPDLFLSVSEDGTVRQHDLRTSHNCWAETCPAPLVEIGHSLSTLAISPLTPHQFVVAGNSPYGYLYDRRHLRRVIESEWGAIPRAGQEATTCVRKFGRLVASERTTSRRLDHITGARMSRSNGHEVILSYSGDGVYMFSTHDEPEIKEDASPSLPSVLPSTKETPAEDTDIDSDMDESITLREFVLSSSDDHGPKVPIIGPRQHYTGARNVDTVKDGDAYVQNKVFLTKVFMLK